MTTLNVDTIQDSAGTGPTTMYAKGEVLVKGYTAYVRFNQGSTPDVSFNISSVTDAGTAEWEVTVTSGVTSGSDWIVEITAGYNATGSFLGWVQYLNYDVSIAGLSAPTTTKIYGYSVNASAVGYDVSGACVHMFGDLA